MLSPHTAATVGEIWLKLASLSESSRVSSPELLQTLWNEPVIGPAGISDSSIGNIAFISHKVAQDQSDAIECSVLIAPADSDVQGSSLVFRVDKPRLRFIQLCNTFFPAAPQQVREFREFGPSEQFDASITISPSALIGENVSIGLGTEVCAGAVIHSNSVIGENCYLSPGVVVGGVGFGYEQVDGEVISFPHYGHVVIGNNVEIGSNSCIDRGSLRNTVIGDNVKIDNLVHVAHNTVVKDGSFIIAGAVLCGSAAIGPTAWIAPNAVVAESVSVGENSFVGFATVVKKDLPDNHVATGSPIKIYPRKF